MKNPGPRGSSGRCEVLIAFVLAVAGSSCRGLPPAGVVVGGGSVRQEVFWRDPRLTKIRSMSPRQLNGEPAGLLYVAGGRGVTVLSRAGKLRSFIPFDTRVGTVVPIDVDHDGRFELMSQGGAWQPALLMDAEGRTRWKVGGSSSPNHMTAADLDGDGSLGFLVGFNGLGGVARLDTRGRTVWKRPATNVWTVAAVDTDGDGVVEILHSSHRDGGIVVRNGEGEKLRVMHGTSGAFCVSTWAEASGSPFLAYSDQESLSLVDFSGKLLRRLRLPVDGHAIQQAIPVRLQVQASSGTYFAAVRTISATGQRSALFLYDASGALIHAEIFATSSLALAAIPDGRTGAEMLLVGAGSEVLAYRIANP